MSLFLTALFTTSPAMSAVILLMLLFNKLLTGKVSAKFRCHMWLVILIGLLIPFRPDIPLPLDPIQTPMLFEPETASGTVGATPHLSSGAIPYTLIIFGIWLTGALTVMVFHLRSYNKFVSSVCRWGTKETNPQLASALQGTKDRMGMGSTEIEVKSCEFISSPMLIGFFKPTILLPERSISSDELEHILRHELTHYRRKDLWINLLILIVSAMHWFNPLVHLTAKVIRTDCEAACDEAVVEGKDTGKRKHYGEIIIGFCGIRSSITPVLSTYFYGGSNGMKKRLSSIMDTNQKGKGLAAVCMITVVLMTLIAGSVFASPGKPSKASRRHSRQAVTESAEYIGSAEAKAIALSAAGFSESQVSRMKVELEREDGIMVYEVEFNNGRIEYEYEINAVSGAIIKSDVDYDD